MSEAAHRRRVAAGGAHGPGVEVTVVLVSCDRGDLLRQAAESVRAQSGVAWECVVVDDCSVDDQTLATLDRLSGYDRFRVVRHPERRGLAAARNTGIALASAPHVCFLDDDDYLCDRSLQRRARASAGDHVGVYCDWVSIGPDDRLERFRPLRRAAARADVSFATLDWTTPFIASAPLVARDALVAVGGFNEALPRAEDAELWFRLLRWGGRFRYVRHIGVAYRRSPGSMVLQAPSSQLELLSELAGWLDRPFDVAVGPLGVAPELLPLTELKRRLALAPQTLTYVLLAHAVDGPDVATRLVDEHLGHRGGHRAQLLAALPAARARASRRLGDASRIEAATLWLRELLAADEPGGVGVPASWVARRDVGGATGALPEWRQRSLDAEGAPIVEL